MKIKLPKIKCAQTFVFKSKCKFCGSGPEFLYYLMNKIVSQKNFYAIMALNDKHAGQSKLFLANDFYTDLTVKNRTFRPSYLFDFNTMTCRTISAPNSKFQSNRDRYISILECKCGHSNWLFTDSKREHIKNRKCALTIPKKLFK